MSWFRKKSARDTPGRKELYSDPPDMTSEDHRERKKAGQISRRRFLWGIFGSTLTVAAKTVSDEKKLTKKVAGYAADKTLDATLSQVKARRIRLNPEDYAETPLSTTTPSTVVDNGNSLAYGYQQEPSVAISKRVAKKLSRRIGKPVDSVSGAVPGSLPSDVARQYTAIKDKIPPDNDQHIILQALDNAANARPDALANLRAMNQNPGPIEFVIRLINYIFQRGEVTNAARKDIEKGAQEIIRKGGGKVKSVKIIGPAPTDKAQRLQQLDASGKPSYTDIRSDKAMQIVLKDYEDGLMEAARDAASTVRRKTGVQTAAHDIRDDVNASNYESTGTQHYDDDAADKVAGGIAKKFRPRNIK